MGWKSHPTNPSPRTTSSDQVMKFTSMRTVLWTMQVTTYNLQHNFVIPSYMETSCKSHAQMPVKTISPHHYTRVNISGKHISEQHEGLMTSLHGKMWPLKLRIQQATWPTCSRRHSNTGVPPQSPQLWMVEQRLTRSIWDPHTGNCHMYPSHWPLKVE